MTRDFCGVPAIDAEEPDGSTGETTDITAADAGRIPDLNDQRRLIGEARDVLAQLRQVTPAGSIDVQLLLFEHVDRNGFLACPRK